MTAKYEIIIYWSQEDQALIAEVPELPGCAADGKTYQEALGNVEVIIREWIKTAKELCADGGIPPPIPYFMKYMIPQRLRNGMLQVCVPSWFETVCFDIDVHFFGSM